MVQLLVSAFKNCLAAFPVILYTMSIMACVFATLIYLVESRENIDSMSQSAWLVLSTMTTVGFGDVVPKTDAGCALTSALMISSSLYMAMPFGLIGSSFTEIWQNRHSIMLVESARHRLDKFGFHPQEIPELFEIFDLDQSDQIDMAEFRLMLANMEIGLTDDSIDELFKVIDKDAGGSISVAEFVKTLYPDEYREMCCRVENEEG